MMREIERDDLDVTPDHVLVLKNAGPKGGPGMPEWGMLPIPKRLLAAGRARHGAHLRRPHERHELRRLHPACRAGKLRRRPARLRADRRRDRDRRRQAQHPSRTSARRSSNRRRAAWTPPPPHYPRGYGAMFSEHIGQADEGCDFDFLQGTARDGRAGDSLRRNAEFRLTVRQWSRRYADQLHQDVRAMAAKSRFRPVSGRALAPPRVDQCAALVGAVLGIRWHPVRRLLFHPRGCGRVSPRWPIGRHPRPMRPPAGHRPKRSGRPVCGDPRRTLAVLVEPERRLPAGSVRQSDRRLLRGGLDPMRPDRAADAEASGNDRLMALRKTFVK